MAITAAQKFHPRLRILVFPFHYVWLLSSVVSWLQDGYYTSRHCIQVPGRRGRGTIFTSGKQRLFQIYDGSPLELHGSELDRVAAQLQLSLRDQSVLRWTHVCHR